VNGTSMVLHPPTCLCFCVLPASALAPTCSCFVFCTQNLSPQCILEVLKGVYKPFSLLSALLAMGLSGLAVAPAPAPCTMHDTRRPRSRWSRWIVLGLLAVAVAAAVFCLINTLPPACVFVFFLHRHSLPPARVLCLVPFTGLPHGKKMRTAPDMPDSHAQQYGG
jgi:hypothetical protein